MNKQQKLYKVFHLIRLLNTPPAKDVSQLMRHLDLKQTQVYEYLKLLEQIGYPIHTNSMHRKSLQFSTTGRESHILTDDELEYLQGVLNRSGNQSQFAESILHKFDAHLSLIPVADALPQLHASKVIQRIRIGIQAKQRMKIIRYRSLTSHDITDRYIEPLELTLDYRYLIAWDTKKHDQRQFKIDRIEDIELIDDPITTQHIPSPMDIFGLTGDQWYSVKMKLSNTAHHLLVEEFPLSRQYVRKFKDHLLFDGMVRNWKGIGRFVLGLPGEVEVVEPDTFISYLSEKMSRFRALRK